ncbi:MAG: hydantoinase/oxoprolinase family protein, partial [Candidatus Tectomicrobia bacterium]|nr:hydantoinase/oxoprolinase family protein [Candidatus Tectomicrobia bacterium]
MASDGQYLLGIDIGGTFTDMVLLHTASSRLAVHKCLTTPGNPAEGVMQGLTEWLAQMEVTPQSVHTVIHATTLITNSLIERKGAPTGLLTTEGCRDILQMGRENRYDLYDLALDLPEPLVARPWRLEVGERLQASGEVYAPLDVASLRQAAETLYQAGVGSVAICFLHAHVNDQHEREARRLLQERYPGLGLSLSSEVAREIGEYERTSTTVVNAYVQPLAQRYLRDLHQRLQAFGVPGQLYIMLSSGGISTSETAGQAPVRMIESGPAAGALAGSFFGSLSRQAHVIAFDMGGTTAKACLIDDGHPVVTFSFEAARVQRFKKGSGFPLQIPAIDLLEVGAGGGSLAHIDAMGLLKVGPQSAGAEPGPACYGRGGANPTVTDADLVLGYLNPDFFLGGTMPLDLTAAKSAIDDKVAQPLGMDVSHAAWGIREIIDEQMASAMRIHIAEKGRDPRDYTLVATGGAGPLHAFRIAEKLHIRHLLCPLAAGVASTIGLLVAPPKVDLVHSRVWRLSELDWDALNRLYAELEQQAVTLLKPMGEAGSQLILQRLADMRYVGQGHQIVVPLPDGELGLQHLGCIDASFEQVYTQLYGRSLPGTAIEGITWRLTALGQGASFDIAQAHATPPPGQAALRHHRLVYLPEVEDFVDVPVYNRYAMPVGMQVDGPAIVEERESTLMIGQRGQ